MCAVLISVICNYYYYYYCYFATVASASVCAQSVPYLNTLLDFPLPNRLHFEYEHGRPLFRAKGPLASFPLPTPVRASVPLRMGRSTEEKEDYVL